MQRAIKKIALGKLEIIAVILAVILSIACLVRGAVDDVVLALLLLMLMPLMLMGSHCARAMHNSLKIIGVVIFIAVLFVLLLQQLMQVDALWAQAQQVTKLQTRAVLIEDKAAWFQSIGRLLSFGMVFITALAIGSSESSARLFLQALFVSGILCLAATFFLIQADERLTSSQAVFHHGFVNANNAASYMGVLFLLTLTEAARFFRNPLRAVSKILPDVIDKINALDMIKGFFLLFAFLLVLSGLFLTGSRGGIFLSLICGFLLSIMIILKTNLKSRTRQIVVVGGATVMVSLLLWSFVNFGQKFSDILEHEGLSHHTRLDIFSAVIPMIKDHWMLGVGAGNFPAVFLRYRPQNIFAEGTIDKAHNSYLEFAAEMGVPLLLLLMGALLAVGYILYCGYMRRKERYLMPLLGLSILLLMGAHSMIDFPLQIPALAMLTIAVVTVCASQTDPRFSEPTHSANSAPIKRIRVRKKSSATRK